MVEGKPNLQERWRKNSFKFKVSTSEVASLQLFLKSSLFKNSFKFKVSTSEMIKTIEKS
jgi:hypothetical protein